MRELRFAGGSDDTESAGATIERLSPTGGGGGGGGGMGHYYYEE